jgi:hypothetical protein
MLRKAIEAINDKIKVEKAPMHYSHKFDNYLTNMLSINKINCDSIYVVDSVSMCEFHESDITFIDVTDAPDTISFTPINKIYKEYKKHESVVDSKRFKLYLQAQANLYPLLKYIKNYKGAWCNDRVEMKIGKFVRKVAPHLTDKDVEDFVNQYKSLYKTRNNPKFEFIQGKNIKKWYNQDNYLYPSEEDKDGLGPLGKSCMRYGYDYFDIYIKNPQVCSLMILKSDVDTEKIIGRALVWKLSNGTIYMDRIYTHFDSDVNLFRNYAKQNGWVTHYDNIKLKHDEMEYYQVDLENVDFFYYPYVDTFYVLDLDNKKAHSSFYNKSIKVEGLSKNLISLRTSRGEYHAVDNL